MFGGAVISEDEVERISRELGIPFCIENDVDVVTFIIRTEIAGTQFIDGFERLTEGLEVGDVLDLRRMPLNEHDHAAVAVYRGGERIGYVPRVDNRAIASLMDSGHRIVAEAESIKHGRITLRLSMVSKGRRLYRHFADPYGIEFTVCQAIMEHCPSTLPSYNWKEPLIDFEMDPIRFDYRRNFG